MKSLYSLLVLMLLACMAHTSHAATYYLSAPSNSAALQALVDQAVAGDIIVLRTGDHYITTPIRLPVGKNGITIRGEAAAVLRKAPNTYNAAAFEVSGNDNVFDLLEIDGGNLPEAGILLYGQHNTVSNSKIHNCGSAAGLGAGILLHNSGNPVCARNIVIGCSVYYNYMVGISQNGHSDGIIQDNRIYENGAEGLTIDIRSHNNVVTNNWIHLNNTADRGVGGVGIDFANGNRLDNNTIDFTRFRSGITFQNNIGGCDGTVVSNNHINNNEGYGILERWTQFRNTNTGFQNNELLNNRRGPQMIIYSDAELLATSPARLAATALALAPNPAREFVTLTLDADLRGATSLTIQDVRGRTVYRQALAGDGQPVKLNQAQLPGAGIYLVTVATPTAVATRKLVVAR
ncbi:right-handed parallel beta-helix repeat-containing protein [uncultured Hymenobacter sp.]|uniref:right-handed parallel beta-helix repeat-containing protein n=1 Tax=uncultured Hymenobacter sp. TaxID=170016 RepID=UPI0035CA1653